MVHLVQTLFAVSRLRFRPSAVTSSWTKFRDKSSDQSRHESAEQSNGPQTALLWLPEACNNFVCKYFHILFMQLLEVAPLCHCKNAPHKVFFRILTTARLLYENENSIYLYYKMNKYSVQPNAANQQIKQVNYAECGNLNEFAFKMLIYANVEKINYIFIAQYSYLYSCVIFYVSFLYRFDLQTFHVITINAIQTMFEENISGNVREIY